MVGLLDIAPIGVTVDVEGQKVIVPGISAEGIAHLLQEYPALFNLRGLIASQGDDAGLVAALIGQGPGLVASVIAAGCGYPGNQEAIKKAAGFPLTAQADLLDAILRKTLTRGLIPFVERLNSIAVALSPPPTLADKIKKAQAQKKASPKPSTPSLDGQGIQPSTSGA
jgi:hypothetical protein